jgi:hypothetical protein
MKLSKICRPKEKTLILEASTLSTTQFGGGERDRTDDLLRARQALSQLSYTPILESQISNLKSQIRKAWWA